MHWKNAKILLSLILWRLLSVFVVQTAHVPDEYWQSLEVAHRLAFGYGYLTWEWSEQIRSYVYPFLISLLYRTLGSLSLDNATSLTLLPRLFQAVISAYADYRYYKWTGNKWMLYSLCINWYWYYCATRTLINSLETSCTIIALTVFPWRDSDVKSIKFLWLVGFLCTVRPTAIVVWAPLCFYHFCTSPRKKFTLLWRYCAIGSICLSLSVSIDSYYYDAFVVSPWNFFHINVMRKVGDTYGKQDLLWYIFSALPVVLGLQYVTFLMSVWEIVKHPSCFHRQAVMLMAIGWTLCVYSLLSHKEFRFLLPLLPMLIYVGASCTLRAKFIAGKSSRYVTLSLLLIANVVPGIYFSLIHQRGSLDVMNTLRSELVKSTNTTASDVLFLTPCHATPLYSHLHVNVPVRFLTCEPNLEASANYVDEADRFFAHPMLWLEENYLRNESCRIPAYVVMFDNVSEKLTQFLKSYEKIAVLFHAHFPQSNYGKYIEVYKNLRIS